MTAADRKAPTGAKPTLGELLLGIEGLALLRLAFSDDAEARRARVNEIRVLLRMPLSSGCEPCHHQQ